MWLTGSGFFFSAVGAASALPALVEARVPITVAPSATRAAATIGDGEDDRAAPAAALPRLLPPLPKALVQVELELGGGAQGCGKLSALRLARNPPEAHARSRRTGD